MVVTNKTHLLKMLPKRWLQQYPNGKKIDGFDTNSTYIKLKAENPLTEEKANKIIGNNSWTENRCDECDKDVFALCTLGKQLERPAFICLDCLNKAINLEGWK